MLKNHLHINHATSFHIPLYGVIISRSHWEIEFLTEMQLNMATAWLPTYNGALFSYWRHTEFLVAGVLPSVVKPMGKWYLNFLNRYWYCADEIALNHV